jgi:hypothetical protein
LLVELAVAEIKAVVVELVDIAALLQENLQAVVEQLNPLYLYCHQQITP